MRLRNDCDKPNQKREILVLGDSHATVFGDPAFRKFENCHFEILAVRGASAYGLRNHNSVTRAYHSFKQALNRSEDKDVIVLLGGVDTDFLIWHRAKLAGRSIERFSEESISAYCGFLSEIAPQRSVTCISAPLPTVADEHKWGRAINSERAIAATQMERTNLTLNFNRKMQMFCGLNGVEYLMLDQKSLGNNGLVKRNLLSTDAFDHHYDDKAYALMIVENLSSQWVSVDDLKLWMSSEKAPPPGEGQLLPI